MSNLVKILKRDGISILAIDNPPVNALSQGVPEGLMDAIDAAQSDASVSAIVIMGAGKTFPAGADINELQAAAKDPSTAPDLHPVLAKIEGSAKPVVMAIHGTALGGGLEIALAGHYRIAAAGSLIGAPEANLGIIPGAEGTQRLPRVVGVDQAVNLCVSGRPIKAADALAIGLIDRMADAGDEESLQTAAVQFAAEVAQKPFVRTRDRSDKLGTPESNAQAYEAGRKMAARFRPHQTAPLKAIEAIDIATRLPFDEGCRAERAMATEILASPQAQAMIHVFFAERAVGKIPGLSKDTPTYPVRKIGIIGAGTMGGGIAMACANARIPVLIQDTTQEALDRGIAHIRSNYQLMVDRGRMSPGDLEARMQLIEPRLTLDDFGQVDLVVEAAFESMEVKQRIFSDLAKLARPDCVLATNTSTLDIDKIAACTDRPEMVVGLHFFSPAHVMRLLEIVRGSKTSNEVIATALSVAKLLKKVGVVVGNGFGFVGNRMMFPYMREAQFLVEEGASPLEVDQALTNWGMAMGIMAVDDMGGIDLLYRVRQEHPGIFLKPGVRRPVVHDALYHAGRYGQKTSAGWYKYDDARKPSPDPEVDKIIEQVSREAGIERRSISGEEIAERCLYAMINEGARILADGVASRASDLDVIYCTGYGFPAWRGGPMFYADAVGLKQVHAKTLEFEQRFGSELWSPAPLLAELAQAGSSFTAWDAGKTSTAK